MLRCAAMSRTLFGTDGVRGRANEGNMTPEVAFRLGAALTYQAKDRVKHRPRLLNTARHGRAARATGEPFRNDGKRPCTTHSRKAISTPPARSASGRATYRRTP